MKAYSLLTVIFIISLISCDQKKRILQPAEPVRSKKIVGIVNTDSNTPPKVTILTAANAPKIIPAGKPVIIQNPNKDGLGDPDFTYYGTEQGLALDNTTAALLDKTGNLWFASWGGGVSRYDGKKFTVFSAANGMDNGIIHMAQDTDGNLWFDAGGYLYKYDGAKFSNDSAIMNISKGVICIYADKKGNTWFGTSRGLIKYRSPEKDKPEEIKIYSIKDGLVNNFIQSIREDRDGNLWIGTNEGISKFDGLHFTSYTKDQGLIKNNILAIEEDVTGNIWFGTDSGICKFDGNHFTGYTTKDGLINNTVTTIKVDSQGTLWFGTDSGISKYEIPATGQTGCFINYTKANGLSDNKITNITEDRTGNMWIGTERGGVCKYNRNNLTKFTTSLGLAGNLVRCITQDHFGNLWFGTDGNGISKYDGKTFANYSTAQGLSGNDVYSMLEDKAGNIWFGCYGSISKFDGKKFTNYSSDHGIPDAEIWNMIEDKKGNLWFTSWEGVIKFDGKSFTRYTKSQGLVDNEMLSVLEDQKGNMWFSAAGLSKFDGKHFTNYTTKNGMLLDEIPGLLEDAKGNIWLGTYGKGVSLFNNDFLTTFTTTQGITDNAIFKMREDTIHHRIWFATNGGLSVMKTNTQPGKESENTLFENFNYKTGYQIKDFSFNFSLFIDNKGVIWAGSGDRKLIRFDYNRMNRKQQPFSLQLQNITINNENICWNALHKNLQNNNDSLTILNEMILTFGKVLSSTELKNIIDKYQTLHFDSITRFNPIPQNLVLPYTMHNISFEFAAIVPSNANQVKYQYMLEGYDKGWSPLTYKTNAGFGNIPEGFYTFRLKALNPSGVWSEISYQFKVLPPFYRTWWAYSIYALLFMGALRIFSKWREQNLRTEKEILETKVEERTHELKATLENLKSTQSQLVQSEKMASLGQLTAGIAHEIQNPLNFVNNFSEVSNELLTEMKEELKKGNSEEAIAIADDVQQNMEKVIHHGKRADSIVKGMLQHSRSSTGTKELTDINTLADEYLRLAYQGLRAKDKSFNSLMKTDLDEATGKINIIPQDIGRVLLNLYNNAFYTVNEKKKTTGTGYEPAVSVTTRKAADKIIITVADNGSGIPRNIIDKIFQPFFTTKPTGQGTGLGLSLSYDIIKAHNGTLGVKSTGTEGSEFIIELPAKV